MTNEITFPETNILYTHLCEDGGIEIYQPPYLIYKDNNHLKAENFNEFSQIKDLTRHIKLNNEEFETLPNGFKLGFDLDENGRGLESIEFRANNECKKFFKDNLKAEDENYLIRFDDLKVSNPGTKRKYLIKFKENFIELNSDKYDFSIDRSKIDKVIRVPESNTQMCHILHVTSKISLTKKDDMNTHKNHSWIKITYPIDSLVTYDLKDPESLDLTQDQINDAEVTDTCMLLDLVFRRYLKDYDTRERPILFDEWTYLLDPEMVIKCKRLQKIREEKQKEQERIEEEKLKEIQEAKVQGNEVKDSNKSKLSMKAKLIASAMASQKKTQKSGQIKKSKIKLSKKSEESQNDDDEYKELLKLDLFELPDYIFINCVIDETKEPNKLYATNNHYVFHGHPFYVIPFDTITGYEIQKVVDSVKKSEYKFLIFTNIVSEYISLKELNKDDKNIIKNFVSYKFNIEIDEVDIKRAKADYKRRLSKKKAYNESDDEDQVSIKSDELNQWDKRERSTNLPVQKSQSSSSGSIVSSQDLKEESNQSQDVYKE